MEFNLITTESQLAEFVAHYRSVEAFAFDVETIGENRLIRKINDVCWISFATDNRTDVIPMGHPHGSFLSWNRPILAEGRRRLAEGKEVTDKHYSQADSKREPVFGPAPQQLTPGAVFAALRPVMFGPALKIAHNAKFDLESVAKYFRGAVPAGPHFDTMMAGFIINNLHKNSLKLKDSVKRNLGVEMEKGIGVNIALHSFEDVALYSAIDSELTWQLYKKLAVKLEGSLSRVWRLEMDVLVALCDMELRGAVLDVDKLETLRVQLLADIEEAEGNVYRLAGKAFPINSIQEKQRLLFASPGYSKKPRITPDRKFQAALTERGREAVKAGNDVDHTMLSTSADALEFYRGKDALVDALLAYQDLNKLMTTYVMPYTGGLVKRTTNGKTRLVPRESLLIDGRVHTDFKAHGAETGRISSSKPNMQNIPNPRTDYGKMVRNLFIAEPGNQLVVADYSQIEPRVIAAFSNDPDLIENYRAGRDIYTTIGERLNIDRSSGKTMVLALSYGIGPDKVATSIGCSMTEARQLMTDFEEQFPRISQYKARIVRLARQRSGTPYVETVFGRRRYIPDLLLPAVTIPYRDMTEKDKEQRSRRSRAERQAFNTVIQGSAADIMKLAIVRAHSCFLDEPDINVLLTVHDELVTSTPASRAEETAEAIRLSMEGIHLPEMTVPLIADVKIVDRWGEAK
jgi:DNA polymerase I-like protein with 3'-5' exonuclease and polymerase domains